MDVRFVDDEVHFLQYDIPAASVYPTGVVTVTQIRDADWMAAPPEIRTTSGETLFIPALQSRTLQDFCQTNGVIARHRPDIWADLLEPFLDTWFDPEHEAETLIRLLKNGIPPLEVAAIRHRVGPLMAAYNAIVWDEWHLGLSDLLEASTGSGSLAPRALQAALGDMNDLYRWAMNIADRRPTPQLVWTVPAI